MTEMDLQHPYITRMEQFGTLRDEKPVYICYNCGGEIYEGETYYSVDENIYCKSCMIDFRFTA